MNSLTLGLLGLALAAGPAFAQAGGEKGPERIVWAAHKVPESPYTGPNKPVWHVADILKAHAGKQSWDQPVLLTRDFDGHYISLAPGEKTKCQFYADDRAFGWIFSGQVKITIDGQPPFTATKGYLFDVPPRLSYCMENTGTEPVVFYRSTPAGQVPSYPENETPTPIKGWKYEKAKITSTGGYEAPNQPYLDFNKYAADGGKSRDFAFDGHNSAHIIRAGAISALPPSTSWGHFHENMVEAWVVIEGKLDVLVSGLPLVQGETGDVIQATNERWHRATCHPNSGSCTRLAMTPRFKEGQIHYFQTDQPPGN
ncbi:MAG TPA: cupin domain-containing protein [Rhizomicrobium sp.]|jgi:mannose-6-phosphate isomerase-like protein (cupin superfamily)|nr:cupin domain-containing protein [Rhizomicrobium sp.]